MSPPREAQDALLKRRSSPVVSIVDEGLAHPTASAVADAANSDEDWDMEGAVGLDEVKRVAAKRHSRGLQDSCRAKKHMVPGTVAEAFEFAIDWDFQKSL